MVLGAYVVTKKDERRRHRDATQALESFHYVPSAGEKVTANVSGQQPSLNISGEVKEVEFKKSDTVPI